MKINAAEAARCCALPEAPAGGLSHEQALAATARLFRQRGKPVFVTRGHEGIAACNSDGLVEIPAIRLGGKVDTTGAGDAALSGITATLASGGGVFQAASAGNLAAAVCASKLHQTGTASPAEMLALLERTIGKDRS